MPEAWTQPRWSLWLGASVAFAATILFYRLDVWPLYVWDEARLANKALEMSQHGLSVVTRYAGAPDHWDTKPPLVVWLMALSIQLFGPTEWAVRLPSVLAALLTSVLLFAFCSARLKRPAAGFVAVLVLFCSPGFVGWHGARSGNYDATLALFTTAYLLAGYLCVVKQPSPGRGWLAICAGGVLLAFLTKSVQGLIFIPALVVYAAITGRLKALARFPTTYACVALVALAGTAYYATRERLDPGYVESAFVNEVAGRYTSVIEAHQGPWWYYLTQTGLFPTVTVFLCVGLVQSRLDTGERRRLSTFVALASATYLAVISMAATKLWWYAIPLVPLSAIAAATSLDWLMGFTGKRIAEKPAKVAARLATLLCLAAGALVVIQNFQITKRDEDGLAKSTPDLYSLFLRGDALRDSGIRQFVVLHPGYLNHHGDPYYVAPTLFYVDVLRAEGRVIRIQRAYEPLPAGYSAVVACGPELDAAAAAGLRLTPLVLQGNCGLYRQLRTQTAYASG